jgi:hypothetical protein
MRLFMLGFCIVCNSALVCADHAAPPLISAPSCEGHALDMPSGMLLQQGGIDPLPLNLLIFFIAISFMIPILKYIFRLLKAQFVLFMAAANQDQDDDEELLQ